MHSLEFSSQNTGVGSLSLLQGIKPRPPTLQADSLPAESQGKPKNTGVSSLSLLQIFRLKIEMGSPALQVNSLPTDQLSYQGSPYYKEFKTQPITLGLFLL